MKFAPSCTLVTFCLIVGCGEDAKDNTVLPAKGAEVAIEILEKDGMRTTTTAATTTVTAAATAAFPVSVLSYV